MHSVDDPLPNGTLLANIQIWVRWVGAEAPMNEILRVVMAFYSYLFFD